MVAIAKEMGDNARLAAALTRLADSYRDNGQYAQARKTAAEALQLARSAGDKRVKAAAYFSLGFCATDLEENEEAESYYRQALEAANEVSDEAIAAVALARLGRVYLSYGDHERAEAAIQEAQQRARALGDMRVFADVLTTASVTVTDLARRRDYHRQIAELLQTIGWQTKMITLHNNQAGLYRRFGLYNRALGLATNAVRIAREHSQLGAYLLFTLDTLASVAESGGRWGIARDAYSEFAEAAQASGEEYFQTHSRLVEGKLALAGGKTNEAAAIFRELEVLWENMGHREESIYACCLQIDTYLARDEKNLALETSKRAIALQSGIGLTSGAYMAQDVFWRHYQARVAAGEDSDLAWETLDQARQQMFGAIDNIGDEGLRRNYLNTPAINRAISERWAAEATARGISLAP